MKMESPKIVIIDDDENAVELLEYNFAKNGLDTIGFSDSKTAINYLINNKVDMIVTDWMMPGKDGLELIAAIQTSVNKDTKKFMVSCISDEKTIQKAMQTGIDGYLVKPIKIQDFVHSIKTCLSA
jgi:two-component system alkaline phosphatase synthesis response regulator PhoP